MAAPVVTMQQLIEAGAHFGHQTHRWNPRMKPYIFGERNGIHILDLSQTVPLMARALDFISATARAGGKVLFVGTKRQAQEPVAEAARRAGQHFVNHRWLGGMLTNWKTISGSIRRLERLEGLLAGDTHGLTKKEVLQFTRERDKLELSLGGIRDMGGIPDVMFVIDANKEELAIKEANVLGIPVVAILDSNVDPSGIAFPIPANDDASRAIRLYCEAVASAATRGGRGMPAASGADLHAMGEPLSGRLDPNISRIGGEIISGIKRLDKGDRSRITFETLADITELDVFDETLQATVVALTHQEKPILEQYFIYRDPKDGNEYPIEKKSLYRNLTVNSDWSGPAPPIDGKYPLEHVYLYFRATAMKEKESDAHQNFNRAPAAARA